ncbi:MAG: hypothetical protein GY811_04545, partial [Myxococcales bacterium]|nr:hypothetical protein [Myxococcales bacterium]
MAIRLEDEYPGKVEPASDAYPQGAARNVTVSGDGTGTPLEAAWFNDNLGFQQALLAAAGATPSGVPDTAEESQYLDALLSLITPDLDTVATMIANTSLSEGDWVGTQGYHTAGDGGGNCYEIVAAGTGTDDSGSYIDLSGTGLQAKGLFFDAIVR